MATTAAGVFGRLLQAEPLIRNREVLRASFTPAMLRHREQQVERVASLLVPALRGEAPGNVLLYGGTGTGKTAVVRHVGDGLLAAARERGVELRVVYVNCEIVDTHYRLLSTIANHLIASWNDRVPFTGWPTDEVYQKLVSVLDAQAAPVMLVLDEVDKLVQKEGGSVLYALSRLNTDLKKSRVCIVGISNDLQFTDWLDPRVKSSLGEEEVLFSPYTEAEVLAILEDRAALALSPDRLAPDVLARCASLAGQEHGDARRALDLLRIAAEVAESRTSPRVEVDHVLVAVRKMEAERVSTTIGSLPPQTKLVLLATVDAIEEERGDATTSGAVFEKYLVRARSTRHEPLTQRRVTDLVNALDMLGILHARVVSKGRYGRTKEIVLNAPGADIRHHARVEAAA